MKRRRLWLCAAAAGAVLIAAAALACYQERRGVRVTVANEDTTSLRNVRVHVTGRSYDLGDILPGESKTVRASPRGESHVEIEFLGGQGQPVRLNAGGYFEPGYGGEYAVQLRGGKIDTVRDTVTIPTY